MPRIFNTTGPCHPGFHYMLPPEARLPQLDELIEEHQYFVLHAPRQSGKTTAMRAFAERLRAEGRFAVYATIEEAQGADEVDVSEARWLSSIAMAASDQLPPDAQPPPWQSTTDAPGGRLRGWLRAWCRALGAPLVLLLDEVDVLAGAPLVNFLRQLRAGFPERLAGNFPASVALIGMRDLRDWLTAAKDGERVNPGSPFNIKVASLTLDNFTAADVAALLGQHTADTGQVFEAAAGARVWHLTRGQPFLVNALARAATKAVRDRSVAIGEDVIEAQAQLLIRSRTTHLESLAARLAEPRVAAILQQVILGDTPVTVSGDDFDYVADLGLVDRDTRAIPNPIYREVIARQLTMDIQENLAQPSWPWARAGHLDISGLIDAFRQWWRENADVAARTAAAPYPEALPHLAFMAFLQRVVNGGGRIDREYAAGRGRIDLLVQYGQERHAIELKRVAPGRSRAAVVAEGKAQLAAYLDSLGLDEGWLVVFDQQPGLSWEGRIWDEDARDGRVMLRVRGA